MKILLSNDDGYFHEGLHSLYDEVSKVAEVTVVAPEDNRSGCSSMLTLRQPLRVTTREKGFLSVNGSPADCVHLAITGMMEILPDLVISGINNGENMGSDVIYSGTVAAAIEGRFLKLPAMAISLAGKKLAHYKTAARVAVDMLHKLEAKEELAVSVLNVNVPDLPYDELNGYAVTRLGSHFQSSPIIMENPGNGDNIYRIGPAGEKKDCGTETDFYAVELGKVSVTPITIDMTHHEKLQSVDQWLNGKNK